MTEREAPPPRPSTTRLSTPPMATLEQLPRPKPITVSFRCWLTGGLLVGVLAALTTTRIGPMLDEFAALARDRDPDASRATIDQVAAASVLVIVGAGALLAVAGVAFGYALRAGRGWSRPTLVVFAAVAVGYAVLASSALSEPMLAQLRTPVTTGLFAYAALVLAATVGMLLPGTNPWFHRPRHR